MQFRFSDLSASCFQSASCHRYMSWALTLPIVRISSAILHTCGKVLPSSSLRICLCMELFSSFPARSSTLRHAPSAMSLRIRLPRGPCRAIPRGSFPLERVDIFASEIFPMLSDISNRDSCRLGRDLNLNVLGMPSKMRDTASRLSVSTSAFTVIAAKPRLGVGSSARSHIRIESRDKAGTFLDLLREVTENIVLQFILLTLVACLHQLEARHINVQVHLLFDSFITSAERLDFRIGKRGLVNILTGAQETCLSFMKMNFCLFSTVCQR